MRRSRSRGGRRGAIASLRVWAISTLVDKWRRAGVRKHGLARRIADRPGRAAIAAASLAIFAGLLAAAFLPGPQGGGALAAVLRDPMAMFAARSPGERPDGALTRSKKRLAFKSAVPPGAAPPTERVLSTGRMRPAPVIAGDPLATVVGPAVALGNPVPFGSEADPSGGGEFGPALPAFGSGASIGIGLLSGGGGVGGGGGNPTPGTPGAGTPVPEITTPVPEPATWLSMIVGLAVIGAALRRRNGRAARDWAVPLAGEVRLRDAA